MVLAPIIADASEYRKSGEIFRDGFARAHAALCVRWTSHFHDRRKNHTIEIMVDRSSSSRDCRAGAIHRTALKLANGLVTLSWSAGGAHFSENCVPGLRNFRAALEPRSFSFNSPYGACRRAMDSARNRTRSRKICGWSITVIQGALGPARVHVRAAHDELAS